MLACAAPNQEGSMTTLAVAASMAALVAPHGHAPRTVCHDKDLLNTYSAQYHAVKREHGAKAPGRNIRRWGKTKTRKSTCHQLAVSVRVLRGMRYPGARLLRPVPPPVGPAGSLTLRATGAPLASIAACESGSNPNTNTGNGFYGKYQFTQSTWESVGGSGNPAAASEAEQDQRAAMLYAREGASPWPVCGR